MVESRILQPGDISAVYNDPYKELVLGYYNPDPQVCVGRIFFFEEDIVDLYFFFLYCVIRLERSSFGAIRFSPKDMIIEGKQQQQLL